MLYGVGTTVGAGIYALLGEITRTAGYFAPLSFLLAGVLAGITAVSFATLAGRYPQAAGIALYIQKGFQLRWLAAAAGILGVVAGLVSSAALLNGLVGYAQEFVAIDRPLLITGVAVAICALACWGINQSVWVAGAITVMEVGGLLWAAGLAASAASVADADWSRLLPEAFDVTPMVIAGAVLAFYAYIGFEDMIEVAEEVTDVRRTLPRAIFFTVIVSTLLYLMLVIAALLATSAEFLAASDAPLADLFRVVSTVDPRVISMIGLFAIVNGALIQVIMASRILYGLASRGQLPAGLAYIHPGTQTPTTATILAGLLVLGLALGGSIATLAEFTSVVILLLFAMVNLSLLRVEWRRGPGKRSTALLINGGVGSLVCLALISQAFGQRLH